MAGAPQGARPADVAIKGRNCNVGNGTHSEKCLVAASHLWGWSCWCRCGPPGRCWHVWKGARTRCPRLAPGDRSSACKCGGDPWQEAPAPPGKRGTEGGGGGGHQTLLHLKEETKIKKGRKSTVVTCRDMTTRALFPQRALSCLRHSRPEFLN